MFSSKERKRTKELIKQFMGQRDFPGWFVGLSDVQIDAANTLMNNIRDDSEQGTCHRVRDTLIKLGINPVVNCAKIKLAMRLSRGNDMAFIYFLMDLFYRHTCDHCQHSKVAGYTCNEQLCMSVIAHLDVIPTLREMDRLMPPQPPQTKPKKKKIRRRKRTKSACVLPYFEKQRNPPVYGKSLLGIEPVNIPSLGFYNNYRNPNYVVPNMKTRWFSDYKLKEGQRIAKGVIDDQLDTILELEKAGTLSETVKQEPVLCTLHTTAQFLKENLANELKVLKKKACEKYFDMEGHFKDKSSKRVVESLEAEILKAQEHFNKSVDRSVKCPEPPEKKCVRRKSEEAKTIPAKQNMVHSEKFDYGHGTSHEQKNDFFEAPSCHKPYKFNYEKIFDLGARNPIQDSIANALRTCSEAELLTDHTAAVRECCKDIWAAEVNRYNKKFEEKRRELVKEMRSENPEEKNLGFKLPYYDPHNRKLMEALVFRSLKEIRKDKKFVLAGMPDAYKVPVLREFTKIRYGMVYTKKNKRKEFKKLTKKIFHLLLKDEIRVKIPQIVDVSEKRIVTYKCRDYVFKKTNFVRDQYHHNFAVMLMKAVRICWGAVRPYQCTKGPPREVFFSYLPAREKDIIMFRPWNINEFIHAKEEWDRRQKIKQMALKY